MKMYLEYFWNMTINILYLPLIVCTVGKDKDSVLGELSVFAKQRLWGRFKWAFRFVTGVNLSPKKFYQMTFGENGGDVIYYVNGANTSYTEVQLQGTMINNIFGKRVRVMYNTSHGLIADSLEYLRERFGIQYSDLTHTITNELLEDFLSGKKLTFVGYSHGALILQNVINNWKDMYPKKSFEHVTIYTFAAATCREAVAPGLTQEHFCNEYDVISRVGLLSKPLENHANPVYTRKHGFGHYLNQHYLRGFANGEFCGGTSDLYHMIDTESCVYSSS